MPRPIQGSIDVAPPPEASPRVPWRLATVLLGGVGLGVVLLLLLLLYVTLLPPPSMPPQPPYAIAFAWPELQV